MASNQPLDIDLNADLNSLTQTPLKVWPGQLYHVQTKAFHLAQNCLAAAGDFFAQYITPGPVLLLLDAQTKAVAGSNVQQSLLASGYNVSVLEMAPSAIGKVEATDVRVDEVFQAIGKVTDCVGVIAVGSGTINDLAKLASHRAKVPYAVVATAASMNGYTSAIAAILDQGIKRSIGCTPPVAVFADLEIVAAAPHKMTAAGLGDLLSKPVSSGDWRLSHLLLGEPFSETPIQLVESAFKRAQSAAKGIGQGKAEAVGALLQALLLSGISMASAGTSSPASGGEHLISHYWDMVAPYRSRIPNLHGAQVGVTTLISATLFQHLREMKPTAEHISKRVAALSPVDTYIHNLSACPPELRDGMAQELSKKYPTPALLEERLGALMTRWDEIWTEIGKGMQSPQHLRSVLEDAKAPNTIGDLKLEEWELREAFHRARDIRGRFTVLDLAWEMGHLAKLETVVLQESGVLG